MKHRLANVLEMIEELMGAVLPVLLAVSVLAPHAPYQGVAVLTLWLGFGHACLSLGGLLEIPRWRPLCRGLVAFAVGLIWPVWWMTFRRRARVHR